LKNDLLLQEIEEQSEKINCFIYAEKNKIQSIAKTIKNRFRYIIIAARGSSDNAARYAQYLFGSFNRIQVSLATPSLFTIYGRPPSMKDALIIGISQSGQSPDIISVLQEGKKQGCLTISITNNPKSPLADFSDFCVPLHAGLEKSTAATKTYTTSLCALALFSATLSEDANRISELDQIPEKMFRTYQESLKMMDQVQRYRYIEHTVVIGRGYNYATAFEIALKIKELTKVISEPYSSADFLHGPVAMIQQGFPVILIAPFGKASKDLSLFARDIKKRGGELIIISDQANLLKFSSLGFSISPSKEWISPILSVVPGQLFARQLAIEKGLNPIKPEGISKITETY